MKPVLIVLCAGQQEYRETTLARIAEGYRLVLVSPHPVTWEAPYLVDHVVVDPSDTQGYVEAAIRFAGQYPVSGVLTYHEWCVELAAAIGEKLDVPQCDPVAATRCRDKWATREALREGGVPSAASELVQSLDEAELAAARIGYPVVVKPRALSASFGVSRVSGPAELGPAFDKAASAGSNGAWEHQRGVLAEEYLDGNEISVDSAVASGRFETAIYAKKVLGYAPWFEELGHIVAAPEQIVADPEHVREVVRSAHRALGVDNTVTHTELRLTSRGPRIVEVNGRSGGDVIPDLAWLATGIDIAKATADIAAGRAPQLRVTRDLVAGVRFFYAESSGIVESCTLDPDLAPAPWIRRVQWLVRPGFAVRSEPGRRYFARAGFAIVTADSVAECEARMEAVAAGVAIRTDC